MRFKEIKHILQQTLDGLPDTLNGGYIYYNNVAEFAELSISIIDEAIIKHGVKVAVKMAQVKAAKSNLIELLFHLEDESKHNKPKLNKNKFWNNITL